LNQVSGQNSFGSSTASGAGVAGGGIPPERKPRRPLCQPLAWPQLQDRGIYHAADAMREMYDMGDAPSCSTCGAIMVRNGSCYRWHELRLDFRLLLVTFTYFCQGCVYRQKWKFEPLR